MSGKDWLVEVHERVASRLSRKREDDSDDRALLTAHGLGEVEVETLRQAVTALRQKAPLNDVATWKDRSYGFVVLLVEAARPRRREGSPENVDVQMSWVGPPLSDAELKWAVRYADKLSDNLSIGRPRDRGSASLEELFRWAEAQWDSVGVRAEGSSQEAESTRDLVRAMRAFLSTTKTAEFLDREPELRDRLVVPTALEKVAERALSERRSLVLTGAAGGGKTQLLHHLVARAQALGVRFYDATADPPAEAQEDPGSAYFYIKDASEVVDPSATDMGVGELPQAVHRLAQGPFVVAVNEGPLKLLRAGLKRLEVADRILGRLKRGVPAKEDSSAPVVIDLSAYDPVRDDKAFQEVMGHELLLAVIASELDRAELPPANRAALLDLQELCSREAQRGALRKLLLFVSDDEAPLLWSNLWDLVGAFWEGALRGEPWSLVLHTSDTPLAKRLRQAVSLERLVLTGVDSLLWLACAKPVVQAPAGLEFPNGLTLQNERASVRMACLQLRKLVQDGGGQLERQLQSAAQVPWLRSNLRPDQVRQLVRAINQFSTLGAVDDEDVLWLWIDFELEHRQKATSEQNLRLTVAELGRVSSQHLALRTSLLHSLDEGGELNRGHTWFLTAKESPDAALSLSQRLWGVLQGSRGLGYSARESKEAQLALQRFFIELCGLGDDIASMSDSVSFVTLNFARGKGEKVGVDGQKASAGVNDAES